MKKIVALLSMSFLIFQGVAMEHRILAKKAHARDQRQPRGYKKLNTRTALVAAILAAPKNTTIEESASNGWRDTALAGGGIAVCTFYLSRFLAQSPARQAREAISPFHNQTI